MRLARRVLVATTICGVLLAASYLLRDPVSWSLLTLVFAVPVGLYAAGCVAALAGLLFARGVARAIRLARPRPPRRGAAPPAGSAGAG